MKFDIYQRYRAARHWVWCSEFFDSRKYYLHVGAGNLPPSSNPAEIFETLRAATLERPDHHCHHIIRVRLGLKERLLDWLGDGSITRADAEDVTYQLDHADLKDWRPLLYVINRGSVEARLTLVPAEKRANPVSPEWTIADLVPDEFDVLGY